MQNRREQQQATLLGIAELTEYRTSRDTVITNLVEKLASDMTEDQITSALEALEAKELISSIKGFGARFIRMRLTPQGLTFIDDGRSLTDAPEKPKVTPPSTSMAQPQTCR
ncbi:hypothetical protein CIP107532_00539 [Corynebacterium diphtheriae]|nr:hypothetical protein CIP107532_00539 [Corynebacterium diphtheriae]